MITSWTVPLAAAAVAAGVIGVQTINALRVAIRAPAAIEWQATAPQTVRAGDTVTINWVIRKNVDCPGSGNRRWVGQRGFELTEAANGTRLTGDGLWHPYSIPTRVPATAPPGKLVMELIGTLHCKVDPLDWFRGQPTTHDVSLGPIEFTVLAD